MGHTNTTPNVALPQFSDGDKPTWRGDINTAFQDIDDEFGTLPSKYSAKRRTSDLEFYVSPTGSDTNDGLSPGSALKSASAAISKLPATGGAVNFMGGIHDVSGSPIALNDGMTLRGVGRMATRITTSSGPVIFCNTDASDVLIENLDLRSTLGGGHIIEFGSVGGIALSTINDCVMVQSNPDKSVIYQNNGRSFIDILVSHCNLFRAPTATVPGVYLRNTGNGLNNNQWTDCRVNSSNASSTPFFYLEAALAGTFANDNKFTRITGEQNVGGLLHAYSTNGLSLDNVVDWDATSPYANDIIKVGKSAVAGSLLSRNTVISLTGRRGGTLAAGVSDINCIPAECTLVTLFNCNPSSGNPVIAVPTSSMQFMQAGAKASLQLGRNAEFINDAGATVRASSYGAATTADALFEAQSGAPGYQGKAFRVRASTDVDNRYEINIGGGVKWGNGTDPADTTLQRSGVGVLSTPGRMDVGTLSVGNAVTATTPGTLIRKVEIFNAAGTSLGFVPVYSVIN